MLANLANVFAPVMVSVEVPADPPIVKLPYVAPPPAKVRAVVDVSDKRIVEVPDVIVKFVAVAAFQTVPVDVNVNVLDPRPKARTLVLLLLNVAAVIEKLAVLNVPAVSVTDPPFNANAVVGWIVPPVVLMVKLYAPLVEGMVTFFVPVDAAIVIFRPLTIVPETSDTSPYNVIDPDNVPDVDGELELTVKLLKLPEIGPHPFVTT